jgi:hypothetical protein
MGYPKFIHLPFVRRTALALSRHYSAWLHGWFGTTDLKATTPSTSCSLRSSLGHGSVLMEVKLYFATVVAPKIINCLSTHVLSRIPS